MIRIEEDQKLFKSLSRQPGEIFESKITGCILKTISAGARRCKNCAYSRISDTCKGIVDIRRKEAGNCSTNGRNGPSVAFEVVSVLYEIPEETKKLLIELGRSFYEIGRTPDEFVDIIESQELLLEAEYFKYKNKNI